MAEPVTRPFDAAGVRAFLASDFFSALDRGLAALTQARTPGARGHFTALAAGLASRAIGDSDSCIDLEKCAALPCRWSEQGVFQSMSPPPVSEWAAALRESPAVGTEGDFTPFILTPHNLFYLHRYREYEARIASVLLSLAAGETGGPPFDPAAAYAIDPSLRDPANAETLSAVRTALSRRLCVITGGPGTGKTWTVSRILACLLSQPGPEALRIALAAPTGKAAYRMMESLKAALQGLCLPESVAALLPRDPFTLHRLLKPLPLSQRFRHDADNPLPQDVIIVDEASMVDLALFAKFLDALPGHARLILLGDKDQLASVEAGAVMGDLCDAAGHPGNPLGRCMVRLTRSRRFVPGGLQARLADAVNGGRADEALAILKQEGLWRPLSTPKKFQSDLSGELAPGLARYAQGLGDPAQTLAMLGRVKVLTALHATPFGAESINDWISRTLEELLPPFLAPGSGCPILILENNYETGLFNGDTGVFLPDSQAGGTRAAYFPSLEGSPRKIAPVRLPRYAEAHAVTIHKSQGSEYDEVHVVLPTRWSGVLSRELIYTALTRARQRAVFWGNEEIFLRAVREKRERASGLAFRLSGRV